MYVIGGTVVLVLTYLYEKDGGILGVDAGLQLPSEQIEETVVVAHKAELRKNKNEN